MPARTSGAYADLPAPGRWTAGTRRATIAVYRPSTGTWHMFGSTYFYGRRGDEPV